MKEPEVIDLPPHQWESDRPKKHEPILGPGWPPALAYIVSFAIVFSLSYWLRH